MKIIINRLIKLCATVFMASISFYAKADVQVVVCFEGTSPTRILAPAQEEKIDPALWVRLPGVVKQQQDCIIAASASLSAKQTVDITQGIGGNIVSYDPFVLVKSVGNLSPYFFVKMAKASPFKSVNVFFFGTSPIDPTAYRPLMMIQLGLVAISNISLQADSGGSPLNNEQLSLVYGEVKLTSYDYPTPTTRTQYSQGWNRITNVEVVSGQYITTLGLP